MGARNPFKDQSYSLTKKLLQWALYAFVPLIFIRLYLYPIPLSLSQRSQEDIQNNPIITPHHQEDPQNNRIITTPHNKKDPQNNPINSTPHNQEEDPQNNPIINTPHNQEEDSQNNPIINTPHNQEDPQNNPIINTPHNQEEDPQNNPIINTPHNQEEDPQNNPIINTPSTSSQVQEKKSKPNEILCDYTDGKWVDDKFGPLYNGTTCSTIKDGQNCITHGRPDMGYLYWRWIPKQCNLPRFNPSTFFQLLKNKHLAFIGDSMARNQLESLLCLLSSVSPPDLVYKDGEDNKFRRWHFPSYNINVSIYWSPFLVKGMEKSTEFNYNKLLLDSVDDRWANDMDHFDVLVLSIGHWFLHPAVYYDKDVVLGCHYCPDLNYTEVGFYDVFRKAINTTLKAIIDRRGNNAIDVIVTTFSPSHFEGEWDKAGACPKKKPFKEGEKEVEGMDAEMRKIEVEEVDVAKENADQLTRLRFEALDVTKLSIMRPDGHPGPYMNPFPFANGVTDRVQNDCVHWCLPGPIDTWNEILLEKIKSWEAQSTRVS